jgi:excisionase family DNA binding protein
VQKSENASCNAPCNGPQIIEGEEILGTSEGTIKTSEDHHPPSSIGGGSQTQPGQVLRVHRCEPVVCCKRGTQAIVQEGRRIQRLAGPTHQQPQPRTNNRRRPYKERIIDMNRHSIQFGARESTASSRQHASRLPVEGSVLQSNLSPASERTIKGTPKPPPRIIETLDLLLREQSKGTTGEETSVGTRATESPGQSDVERPLTCEEAAVLVRVHPKTIKRMARDRRLPGHFRFGRWFFYASELDGWMRTELNSSGHSCR